MITTFGSDYTIIRKLLFPYTFINKPYTTKETIILGIGGNIGNTYDVFKKLLYRLKKHPKIKLIQTSPLIKNPPFGYTNQPYFVNAVIIIYSSLNPIELLKYVLYSEYVLGRRRSFRNAPRTIDIDIIAFRSRQMKYHYRQNPLQIPHYDWQNRLSVILPISLCK